MSPFPSLHSTPVIPSSSETVALPPTNHGFQDLVCRRSLKLSETKYSYLFAIIIISNDRNFQVVEQTHFSKNEVRAIYRAFKETSPNAVINKGLSVSNVVKISLLSEILREKFTELFPQGDIEHYSDLLFDTFDSDRSGTINFLVWFTFICIQHFDLEFYAKLLKKKSNYILMRSG